MRRAVLAIIAGSFGLLSGCEDPAPEQVEMAQPPVDAAPQQPETPPVAVPDPNAVPLDSSTLPPDARVSEETVKPESETLFY